MRQFDSGKQLKGKNLNRQKLVRKVMCIGGFALAFVAAGISDGGILLNTTPGMQPCILAILAAVLILPAIIHLAKAGEF